MAFSPGIVDALDPQRLRLIVEVDGFAFHSSRAAFERDRALSRRFQRIDIGEPSVPEAIAILKGLKPVYEEHHNVKYTDPAIEAVA